MDIRWMKMVTSYPFYQQNHHPFLTNFLLQRFAHVEGGEFRVVNVVNLVQVMSARIHFTV